MNSVSGELINDALKENMTLIDLNLARNKLCDMFAEGFANALRTNDVIWKVDISENRFTKVGSKMILYCRCVPIFCLLLVQGVCLLGYGYPWKLLCKSKGM